MTTFSVSDPDDVAPNAVLQDPLRPSERLEHSAEWTLHSPFTRAIASGVN